MRLAFLGSGAFGLPTLQRFARDHELVGVVSQPDRKAGRKRVLTPTPAAAWAAQHLPGVEIVKPEDVNEPTVRDRVRAWAVDAWVIIAFGQKLSEALLEDRFAINLHGSLLPRWRGAAPIQRAVEAGDAEAGNSVITIARRMDAGLVLGQNRRPIGHEMTAGELHDALAEDGPAVIEDVLKRHADGSLEGDVQDESLVTRARKLTKPEGWADLSRPAEEVRCKVHGFTPWPGVAATIAGGNVKLVRSRTNGVEPVEAPPGTLVDAQAGVVACGNGSALRVLEVLPQGKKPMCWADFARGRSMRAGDRIHSGPELVGGAP